MCPGSFAGQLGRQHRNRRYSNPFSHQAPSALKNHGDFQQKNPPDWSTDQSGGLFIWGDSTKKIFWFDFTAFRFWIFKICSVLQEIINYFKSKPCYDTKKIFFYIPRFAHMIKGLILFSAARLATFTGIYQGSRLLSTQGQLRLSDVQANWCLIMVLDMIIADSCHTVFGSADPMLLYPGVTALHLFDYQITCRWW